MLQPVVSVVILTYNHESYIRQCLESVVSQKTDFPFEIIIGEDCSTDNTRMILQEFEIKYPEIIKPIYHDKNVGIIRNGFEFCFNASKGKYIACVDGDDYWCDNNKLQIQVDFLEKNKDYAMSSHNTIVQNVKNNFLYAEMPAYKNETHITFSLVNYLKNHFIHVSSLVYRKSMLKPLPLWFSNVFAADGFLILLLALEGKIHYINKAMSVYRHNENSVSNYFSRVEIKENFEKHFKLFDKHSGYKYSKEIKAKIFSLSFNLNYYNENYLKKISFFFQHFLKIITADKKVLPLSVKYKFLIPAQILNSKVNIHQKKLLAL